MDVLDLALTIGIELNQLLASGRVGGLLKVRADAAEEAVGSVGNAVRLVGCLGTFGRVVLLVKVHQGIHKTVGDAMLVIEFDRALKSRVADNVTVGKVLSQDAASRLLFLGDLVRISVDVGGMRGTIVSLAVSRSYRNLRSLELGVIQKLRGLCGSLLLECDTGIFGVAFTRGNLDIGDLAAIEAILVDYSISKAGGNSLTRS